MRCVSCGNPQIFAEALCKKCYHHYHREKERNVEILLCPRCFHTKKGTQWHDTQSEEEALYHNIKMEFKGSEIQIDNPIPLKGSFEMFVDSFPMTIHIGTVKQLCPNCMRQSSGYYEAIVQVRKMTQKTLKATIKLVEDANVPLHKKLKVTNGYDFYFADKKDAEELCNILRKKYGGIVKKSAKLFTRNRVTSKEVYRNTYLFKFFPFIVGERFTYRGEIFQIERIDRLVTVKAALSGEKHHFTFIELERKGVF